MKNKKNELEPLSIKQQNEVLLEIYDAFDRVIYPMLFDLYKLINKGIITPNCTFEDFKKHLKNPKF